MHPDPTSHQARSRILPVSRALMAAFLALISGAVGVSRAQQAAQPAETARPDSLSSIDADYQRERTRLDRQRIERLTRLAGSQGRGEADLTFLEIFRFAVAADLYADAEPAADLVIRSGKMTPEAEFLARLVKVLAEADRGDYAGSTRDLKAYLETPDARPTPGTRTRTALAIGEAYFRRLVRAGRFDLAREACEVVGEHAGDPAVRDHFAGYRRRLDLVGRPAPDIRGDDADGTALRLEDLKGKVVLVVFWATWCPPCVERLPVLGHALELYQKDGFAVLGVNLDDGPDREPLVRRFIVDFGVPWPSVLNGQGERDAAAAYAVKEIPANVLIGRDGKVITFDLGREDLLEAISGAVTRTAKPR